MENRDKLLPANAVEAKNRWSWEKAKAFSFVIIALLTGCIQKPVPVLPMDIKGAVVGFNRNDLENRVAGTATKTSMETQVAGIVSATQEAMKQPTITPTPRNCIPVPAGEGVVFATGRLKGSPAQGEDVVTVGLGDPEQVGELLQATPSNKKETLCLIATAVPTEIPEGD